MADDALPSHPDRVAPTLAVRARLLARSVGPFAAPGPGSADARVDLKLLAHATARALASRGTDAARARLAGLDTPDLLAGTLQDGTARGLASAYEDALSLCTQAPGETPPTWDEVVEGRDLRRRREVLVASGCARVRFSRKGGILFVDREHDVHEENCIWFEDRTDCGDLDGFRALDGERARLFNPGFLAPRRLWTSAATTRLELAGRLGRRPSGHPCELTLEGRSDEPFVRVVVRLLNQHDDHRLRVRFLGCTEPGAIGHDGTPGWEAIAMNRHRFVAATLVRACGRLRIDDRTIAVPGAQCRGWIEHRFRLGGARWQVAARAAGTD